MITTIDTVYDFLIPIDQIEILGYQNPEAKNSKTNQPKNLIGKWFKGLYVTLNERVIRNRV